MWGHIPSSKKMENMNFFEKADESLELGMKSAKLLGGIGASIGGAMALKNASKRKRMESDREFALKTKKIQHEQQMQLASRQPSGQAEQLIFSGSNAPIIQPQPSNQQSQQGLIDAFNAKQAGMITEEEYNVIKKNILGFKN